MFLDHLNTIGNNIINVAIIEIKEVWILVLNIRYETIKVAIPTATFSP
jgi:hypothetical protein